LVCCTKKILQPCSRLPSQGEESLRRVSKILRVFNVAEMPAHLGSILQNSISA
jgi:hypothetical protein